MMINHLHWQNREQYFELIEQFLNFLDLRKKYRSVSGLEAELILFEPDDRSEDFDDLISEIIMLFDRYCPDPSLRESHEFSEEEVQKIFIELKIRNLRIVDKDKENL